MRKTCSALWILTGFAVACGSSSNPDTSSGKISADAASGDSAGDAMSADDAHATGDAGSPGDGASAGDTGSALDAMGDEAPIGPPGQTTTLDTGTNFHISGVTDDGYVVYFTSTGVNAVPLAGGGPISILSLGTSTFGEALVVHDDVFIWTNIDSTTAVATLSLWSHTLGAVKQLSTTSVDGMAAASADSSAIVFTSGSASDGSTASLYGATMSTLASPMKLASNLDVQGVACGAPWLLFTGTSAPFYAVAGFCTLPNASSGGGPQDVYSYPSTTWAARPLATNALSFAVDEKAVSVAIGLATGQLEIAPVATGSPILIDSAGTLSNEASNFYPDFFLSPNDASVFYSTAAGGLKTSTTTASAPMTLTSSGVHGIDAFASTGAWAIVHNAVDSDNGYPTDLSLASTTVQGTPAPLSTGDTDSEVSGDAFTTDGSYAIYMTNLYGLIPDSNQPVGTLNAVATADPSKTIQLATASVSMPQSPRYSSPSDLVISATKLIYTDNYNQNYTTDLYMKDLASSSAATQVTSGADPFYAVSSDKRYLVYTTPSDQTDTSVHSVLYSVVLQ